jgi:PPOX class probable F420-dependent enzyme
VTVSALDILGQSKYIRLTTFRRDGTPVPTPVWQVRDGDRLLVITDGTTGKVKRLRHTPRVLIAVSDQRGRVKPGVQDVEGTAEMITDVSELDRLTAQEQVRLHVHGVGLGEPAARTTVHRRGRDPDQCPRLIPRTTTRTDDDRLSGRTTEARFALAISYRCSRFEARTARLLPPRPG